MKENQLGMTNVETDALRTMRGYPGARFGRTVVRHRGAGSPLPEATSLWPVLIAFNKPYGFLSQFTPEPGSKWRTLADFGFPRDVYPLGRLDADSEGLLLLSDERGLNTKLLSPDRAHRRKYWAQVERIPARKSLETLAKGVVLSGRPTLPCRAWLLDPQPTVPPRDPPIRFRKNVPDSWIAIELIEGKYHQVRRMTAAIGHPTLRLIRVQIGNLPLENLAPGKWRELSAKERAAVFAS